MGPIVRRIHIYLGLLTLTTLVVFGLVGLTAALGSSGKGSEANIREIDFPIPTSQTDVELARRIVESGVTADVGHDPSWLVSRDADGSMVVIVNGLNGTHSVSA